VTTTFSSGPGQVEGRPSWRDERRRDRETAAELGERHADARLQRQIIAQKAAQELAATADDAKYKKKVRTRKDRADQMGAVGTWCKDRIRHLVLIPVIGVPGVLAADGQAAWGIQQWGPVGLILPAFSEGSMWYFALSASHARKANPDAPVWHLRLGTVVFALVGGAMNFAHGMAEGGIWQGVTMAVTSMAGVTAHQITTAGPRKTRQQRRNARLARKQARKEARVMRAAIADGTVVIGADGRSRMTVRPGAVALKRGWRGTRLVAERDVQSEIDDITEAALVLVDHAQAERAEAAEAAEQARAEVQAATAERDRARAEAETEKDAILAELTRARELAQGLRDVGEQAAVRAEAAEQKLAQAATDAQTAVDVVNREAGARMAGLRTELDKALATIQSQAADIRTANEERDQALRIAERDRITKENAVARAEAAEQKLAAARDKERRPNETKKDHLIRLYRDHPEYGNPATASRTATELAAVIDLSPQTARANVNEHLRETGVLPQLVAPAPVSEFGQALKNAFETAEEAS
jgi:hypothetical protein